MKTLLPAAALLVAAALGASSAQAATVVTFTELKHDQQAKLHRVNPLVSGGLEFRTSDREQGFASWGAHMGNADPTGATLMNWSGKATITISKAGGGLFELTSFDLADTYNQGAANVMEFTFFDGVRTQKETVQLDRAKGLQTFAINRTVEWFSFTGLTGGDTGQIDNVVWGAPVVTGVPEASTWAMMIIGFAGVGGAVRRTRRVAQAAFA